MLPFVPQGFVLFFLFYFCSYLLMDAGRLWDVWRKAAEDLTVFLFPTGTRSATGRVSSLEGQVPSAVDDILATSGKKGIVPVSDLPEILESLVCALLQGSGTETIRSSALDFIRQGHSN